MCISRDGHVAASVSTGTEPPRQPATARRSGHRGTDACEGGHPGTAAGRRRTATPGCAQCRRCHPLLLRRANQGLRRGRRTQDREHPQHGDEPCGRVLRRHRAGQRAERRGGPGTLLARQHGGGDALQRTEERHLPKTPLPQSPRTPTRMPAIAPRASGLSTKTGSGTTTAR